MQKYRLKHAELRQQETLKGFTISLYQILTGAEFIAFTAACHQRVIKLPRRHIWNFV